jgi:hypothetical protein
MFGLEHDQSTRSLPAILPNLRHFSRVFQPIYLIDHHDRSSHWQQDLVVLSLFP